MALEKFEVETSSGTIHLDTEKLANERARDLRKNEHEVLVYKKVYTKKGEVKQIYLIG